MYSHPERYLDFFDGETAARRKGMLYKWTRDMREKGTWADQLFINAIARAHEVCSVSRLCSIRLLRGTRTGVQASLLP